MVASTKNRSFSDAARITQRTVEGVEQLAETITPMAYDIASFDRLGLLFARVSVADAERPHGEDVDHVRQTLAQALADIGEDFSLAARLHADGRAASVKVRERLRAQWSGD